MSTYKNPNIPTIATPYNVDAEIQRLQIALGNGLAWLDKSFAKAELGRTLEGEDEILYPEVYTGETRNPYQNCLPNNKLKSQSFFKVEEPVTTSEENAFIQNTFELNLSVIFWFNLKIIKRDAPYTALDYRFTELLLSEAMVVLRNADAIVKNVYYTPEEVYRGYTINHLKQQELKQPYSGFRIELKTSYLETCL
jgi:hypothetical protein